LEKEVILKSFDGKTSSGKVTIQRWSKKERFRRAAKFLAGAWALAVLSILLPIAHFFLVPAFFLAGPIGAYFVFKHESAVSGGHGICPGCGASFDIVKSPDRWPLEDVCSKCRTHVSILGDSPIAESELT
jgi:hypothetical protein